MAIHAPGASVGTIFFYFGVFRGSKLAKKGQKSTKNTQKRHFFEFFGAKPMIMVLDA